MQQDGLKVQNKIIEDKNILTKEEKKYIDQVMLNNNFPFYWNENQTFTDNYPYFSHCLKCRDTKEIRSNEYYFFEKIFNRFCKKHKITYTEILRGCINLTYPLDVKIGHIHKDHDFPYKQVIIYLTNSDKAYTYLFNSKDKVIKKIKAEKFKVVCFNDTKHAVSYPSYKDRRRVIAVFTFI